MEKEKHEVDVEVEYAGETELLGQIYKWRRLKQHGIRIVTLKVDADLLERIDNCKKKKGLRHRSEIIRAAIKLFLDLEGC